MASRKKNEKDHFAKKSEGGAAKWRQEKKLRNASRPKQVTIIERDPDGTEKITGPFRIEGQS